MNALLRKFDCDLIKIINQCIHKYYKVCQTYVKCSIRFTIKYHMSYKYILLFITYFYQWNYIGFSPIIKVRSAQSESLWIYNKSLDNEKDSKKKKIIPEWADKGISTRYPWLIVMFHWTVVQQLWIVVLPLTIINISHCKTILNQ